MPQLETKSRSLLGEPPAELALRLQGGGRQGQVIRLESAKCSIGGDPSCTLQLRELPLSPVHCLILRGERQTIVRRWSDDTRLNGRSFDDAPLTVGDTLSIGPLDFEVLPPPGLDSKPSGESEPEEPIDRLTEQHRVRRRRRTRQLVETIRSDRQQLQKLHAALQAAERERLRLAEQRESCERLEQSLKQREEDLSAQASGCGEREKFLDHRAGQLDQLSQQLADREAELLEQHRQQTEAERAERGDWRAERVKQQEELAAQQAELTEQRKELDALHAEHQQQAAKLEAERIKLEAERELIDQQLVELTGQESELAERTKQLEVDSQQLEERRRLWLQECDERETDYDRRAQEIAAREQLLEEAQAAFDDKLHQLHSQRVEQDAAAAEIAEAKDAGDANELALLEAELNDRRVELEQLHSRIESDREALSADRQALEEGQQELHAARAELDEQRADLAQQRESLDADRQEFNEQREAWAAKQHAPQTPAPKDDPFSYDSSALTSTASEDDSDVESPSGLSTMHLLDSPPATESGESELGSSLLDENRDEEDVFSRLREMTRMQAGESPAHDVAEAESEESTEPSPESNFAEESPIDPVESVSPMAGDAEVSDSADEHDDDDDSIEQYMAGLLQRMRGGSQAPSPPPQPVEKPRAARKQAEASNPPADSPKADPAWDPANMQPRRSAPEQNVDIAKMRELANMTTKSAIDESRHRRTTTEAISKGIVSTTATVCGIALIYFSPNVFSMGFLCGVASLVVGTNWAIRGAMLMRNIRHEKQRLSRAEARIQQAQQENEELEASSAEA